MKRELLQVLPLAVAVLIVASCASRKQMIYLNDLRPDQVYQVKERPEITIQKDDKLSIKVSCKNPELALVFNYPGTGGYTVGENGSITSQGGTTDKDAGYIVDRDGNIEFPILGKLHVAGMTCRQVVDHIKETLSTRGLIKDPFVTCDIINFKVNFMGEIGKVGEIKVNGDRITLLEAIAQQGDMKEYSKLDSIAVIREVDGHRRIYYTSLLSKDIYDSPVYYLQQNDLIYIQPNKNKVREETRRNMTWFYTGTSLITTIISLITLITK